MDRSPEELNILDALRNRVEVECQCNIGSIPFEIFRIMTPSSSSGRIAVKNLEDSP